MSILIKGLKMPKGDKALVVCINSNGTVDRPNWQWDYTLIKGAEAVELPDHGDLIDKDALMNDLGISPNCKSEEDCEGQFCAVCFRLREAPTVIEAERNEE